MLQIFEVTGEEVADKKRLRLRKSYGWILTDEKSYGWKEIADYWLAVLVTCSLVTCTSVAAPSGLLWTTSIGLWTLDWGWLRVTNWTTHYHKDSLKTFSWLIGLLDSFMSSLLLLRLLKLSFITWWTTPCSHSCCPPGVLICLKFYHYVPRAIFTCSSIRSLKHFVMFVLDDRKLS